MRPMMKRALFLISFLLLGLGWLPSAWAQVEIRRAQVLEGQGATRVVFDLDARTSYQLFTLPDPARIVIDLPSGRLAKSYRAPAARGAIAGIRSGTPKADHLRLVLDLRAPVKPKTFWATGTGGDHRLVVELRKPGSTAAVKSDPPAQAAAARPVIVAIDAGHGGQDPGAIGPRGAREKVVTLAIAKRLKAVLDAEPGMRAVLIRERDIFIPLQQRFARARAAKADLFVSIHADAVDGRHAAGSSVYMLSTRGASSQAARWLANRENAADLIGGVSLGDKDNTLAAVLLDLSQGAALEASNQAANQVLRSLSRFGRVHKREVQRANFVVLRSPDVPSILVETAFISNPQEEKRLQDPAHQQRLAQAISTGIRDFFHAAPPPGTWIAAHQRRPNEHIVARGETLALIAQRHGVTLASLRRANANRGDLVRPGEVLRIPLSS